MSFQPEGIDKIEDLHGKDDFACGNCLKSYKRKTAYEKHITTKSCKKKKIAIVPSDTIEKPSDDVPPRVLENIVDNENPSEPLDEQVKVASIEQIDEKENPPENFDDKSEDEDLEQHSSSDTFDDSTESSSSDDEEEGSVSNTVLLDPFKDIPRNEITEMIISNIQLRAIEKAYLDMDLYRN